MIIERLAAFRAKMQSHDIAAYIIPSTDPHQSEYLPEYWSCRAWLSGFTGSAGLMVVTSTKAGLWTDSRYFLQAETQLEDTTIDFHKVLDRSKAYYLDYLCQELKSGDKVGLCPLLFSKLQIERIKKHLSDCGIEVVLSEDLFEEVWIDRPSLPTETVFDHPIEYAGESRAKKIEVVRTEMTSYGVGNYLVSTLDDIAWLLNLRGRDIRLNPVFMSYLLICKEKTYLYINADKVESELKAELEDVQIYIREYAEISNDLKALESTDSLLLDARSANYSLYQALGHLKVTEGKNIVKHLKSKKSKTEVRHIENAMIKDGVALCHAFHWLEQEIENRTVSEYDFAVKLAACRGEQADYYGESFDAIVGYKSNGAIIHYRPEKDQSAMISKDGVLLVDSGGQYIDGTTDITRTFCLGEVTPEFSKAYTQVLKGFITLDNAVIPEGTNGGQIDILARQYLWASGKNYSHGTGHGVGYFLNVHEGPQGISPGRSMGATTPLEQGMITSNEPGYYVEGQYGIRIENVILCQPSEYENFLSFRSLTMYPIETKAIDKSIFSKEEQKWLNDYHQNVYDRLSPYLNAELKAWLQEKCQSI